MQEFSESSLIYLLPFWNSIFIKSNLVTLLITSVPYVGINESIKVSVSNQTNNNNVSTYANVNTELARNKVILPTYVSSRIKRQE